ncbi:hypothetical protein LTR53_015360, partial [Teratosphaeriaceae sp. CCFEE 6253]
FERYVEYIQQRHSPMDSDGKAFRDTSVACHLPRHLIDRILSHATADRELELMTETQRTAAIDWGMKRETLKVGWLGKDLSKQAWMLLDSIRCLEYGQ